MNTLEALQKQLEDERRSHKATVQQKEREVEFLTRMTAEQKATCDGLCVRLQEKDKAISSLEINMQTQSSIPSDYIPNAREIIERQQQLLLERKAEVSNLYELNRELKTLFNGMMESRLSIEGGASQARITERPSSRHGSTAPAPQQVERLTNNRPATPTPFTPNAAPAYRAAVSTNISSALTPETQRILEKYRGTAPSAAPVSTQAPASQDSRIIDLKRQLEEARKNREKLMATLETRAGSRHASPQAPGKY